jgi:hypothetical protein
VVNPLRRLSAAADFKPELASGREKGDGSAKMALLGSSRQPRSSPRTLSDDVHHAVHLHRALRAPPERVYRAFLDAQALAKWLPSHPPMEDCRMNESEPILAALDRIEQNQVKGLQMQAQQLAFAREQMAKSDAKVKESLALQQFAVARQAMAMKILMPVIALLVALAVYLVVSR